ncbi:hypothetical protein Tco_1012020, partial [Tanacetum coccineum]
MSKLIYTRFTTLIIDHFLSCNKSIPRRSDAKMHSEGQDSPFTKLINNVDGKFKFRIEIPETMITNAINKHKKDESEKGKAAKEPEKQHVSPVRSGRGKGYMCSANQVVNVPCKPRKAVVLKNPRTLIVADNIVEETLVVELAKPFSIEEQQLQQREIMTQ